MDAISIWANKKVLGKDGEFILNAAFELALGCLRRAVQQTNGMSTGVDTQPRGMAQSFIFRAIRL